MKKWVVWKGFEQNRAIREDGFVKDNNNNLSQDNRDVSVFETYNNSNKKMLTKSSIGAPFKNPLAFQNSTTDIYFQIMDACKQHLVPFKK